MGIRTICAVIVVGATSFGCQPEANLPVPGTKAGSATHEVISNFHTSLGVPIAGLNADDVRPMLGPAGASLGPAGDTFAYSTAGGAVALSGPDFEVRALENLPGHTTSDFVWITNTTLALVENWLTPEQAAEFAADTSVVPAMECGVRTIDVSSGATLQTYDVRGEDIEANGEWVGLKSASEWILKTPVEGGRAFRIFNYANKTSGAPILTARGEFERLQWWPVRSHWVARVGGDPEDGPLAEGAASGRRVSVEFENLDSGETRHVDDLYVPCYLGLQITSDGRYVISAGVERLDENDMPVWVVQIADTLRGTVTSPTGEVWVPIAIAEGGDTLLAATQRRVDGTVQWFYYSIPLHSLLSL